MMSLTSFSLWIEWGLLAVFLLLVAGLFFGFYMKASDKYADSRPDGSRSTSKLGFFNRDKRGISRVPCNMVLELRDRTDYVITGSGRMINLSNSGACFTSRTMLSLGERIQGRLKSESNEIIRISGEIVWIRPGGTGVLYGLQFR